MRPSTDVGAPTLAIAMFSGGRAFNIVPDKCQIYVNRRVVPGEDPAMISAAREGYARQHCPLPLTMTIVNELHAFYQSRDTPWIHQLSGWSGMAAATAPYGTNASPIAAWRGKSLSWAPAPSIRRTAASNGSKWALTLRR